ncbi:MAG TPA: trigger factor [Gammaproteobacteria bacterium]|nr:trigger factor [Gammaproteobacteria bacterium]
MEVSVESTGALERRMKVQVPAEKVESEVDSRLKSLGQRAKLKGFRPGKVPLKVVRQQYGAEVRQDVVRDLLQSSWTDAVTEQQLNPAGGPRIDEIKADPGTNLEYTAVFEVYPEIALEHVDNLKVSRPKVEIQPADVDAMLERLREQHAEWSPVERAAASGDQVKVDFHGTRDGKAFPGGHGENVDIVLGEGRMIPGFETGIEGMSPGEERDIDVTFPDDYPVEDLAGRKADFHITARQVAERRLPELDESFLKHFGIESGGVEALRAKIRENMGRELDANVRAKLKNQLLDQLFEANPVELPSALVENEIQRLREEMLARMGVKDPESAPDMPNEMFDERARKRVALGLLIGELIKREQFKADAERVQQKLESLAADYHDPEQMVRAYRANADAMRQVESLVLEEQAVDWLTERAEVTEEPASFAEVMGLEQPTTADEDNT